MTPTIQQAALDAHLLDIMLEARFAAERRPLTVTQAAMLRRLALSRSGDEQAPHGFSTAGRAASAWHRTADVLFRLGHVRYSTPSWIRITRAGRRRATERWV